MRSTTYYTLIGSLPALPKHFAEADRVPISQLQLAERLKLLTAQDAQIVEKITDFLVWERQPLEQSDEEVVRHYVALAEELDRFSRELIQYAMSVRTILAGLRCRRLQREPPEGIAPLATHIAKNWQHPDFQLGSQFPWISDVDTQLRGDAPFDLEKTKLDIAWRRAKRLADQYHFTFEAVLLYLIRWEIVFRWTQRSEEAGTRKFEHLVSQAMGPYANMFG